MSIYDYSVKKQDGSDFSLVENKGKVIIIVNTATRCGFTHQYKELEEMYEKYHENGLEIIDIPCNQFAHQAPESDAEITSFCSLKYNTMFPQMKKADVNGENEIPLYTFLKSQADFKGFGDGGTLLKITSKFLGSSKNKNDIKWNFTKFVIDRSGDVVARFEPTMSMEELDKLIGELIEKAE